VHRFFERHKITVKKKPARGGTGASGRRPQHATKTAKPATTGLLARTKTSNF
jgi:hypothetical protein